MAKNAHHNLPEPKVLLQIILLSNQQTKTQRRLIYWKSSKPYVK